MKSVHLLLVNVDQATQVQRALSRYDDHRFQITVVESGEACLSALDATDFALVLLDYRLPRSNGLAVLQQIRREEYRVPVIMLVAPEDETIVGEVLKAGAVDCVVKRADYVALLASAANHTLHRHRLERRLAASRQHYRALFDSSRDAILVLDDEARIVDLNARAEALLGLSPDESLGQPVFDLLEPEQPEHKNLWHQKIHSQKASFDMAFSFVNPGGGQRGRRIRIEVQAIWLEPPLGADHSGHYQLVVRDITRAGRDQAVWEALDKAALAAHNQLEPESIYRAVAHILLELGLSSSMWWLNEANQALQVRYTTYAQRLQDEFAARTGLDVENLWVMLDRLSTFRDRVMNGETVYVDKGADLVRQIVDADEPELIDWIVRHFGADSILLLPFRVAGRVRGMLLIHGDLRERDVPAARAFATQISSALEHARLFNDAQRRIRELAALQEISFKLGSSPQVRPLLGAVAEVALEITNAHNCHIFLVGEDGFDFGAARRRDGSAEPVVKEPRPDGLVARVVRAAKPILIDDAPQHPLYQTPKARQWGVQAIAGYPLMHADQVLGVFTLTYLEPHRFDQAERHILNLLASQAAAAIEAARLHEDSRRRTEDLSTLYQVALAVSAQLQISDVLDVTYEAINRATGARSFVVGLYLEDRGELAYELIRENGEDIAYPNLSVNDRTSLTAWVASHRRELIIDDLQEESLPVPGVTSGIPARSWMGFPLITGNQLVGVMSVQSPQPRAFDVGHQRLCRGIATQLAIALDKARLLEDVQEQNWELSVINKVSAAVRHSFDLETLLDEALNILLDEMRLQAGAFHLLDTKENLLRLVSQKDLPAQAVRDVLKIGPEEGFSGQVMLSGEPIVVDNYSQNARRLTEHMADYNCFAAIPLSSQHRTVGTLSVMDPHPRHLTTNEVDLLLAVGRQIGVAVENGMLYRQAQERERRLRRLYEAAQSLSSMLESRKLLQRVLETAVGELQASGAMLWLYDQEQGLYPHLALGTLSGQADNGDPAVRAEMTQVLQGKEGVLWVNRERPQRRRETEIGGERGYRAAVPLRGQASEVGVLEVVVALEKDRLTSDDVSFLSSLGGIVAVAHENALLYEALTRYAVSLEAKVKERTAEIRREKERTEAILRSVADGVFVVNPQFEIVLTNPAAERLLSDPDQSERLRAYLDGVAQELDDAVPGPTITLGQQTLQARAAKIRQDGVELGSVIVLRDVTHFEEVNRLKSEFVRTVSHELRTPLSNLKLYLSLLERGRVEKRSDYQRVLAQEVNRLENLIQDLLNLSRLESQEGDIVQEKLNLDEIVSYVMTLLTPQAEEREVKLVCERRANETKLWVRANRDQMVQLVINLVANAINYTGSQGQVTLKLDRQTDDSGPWVILAVQDTGVGIAPDELPRIWDRFYRGEAQRHMSAGTGLGLAIVREILNRHDGWVTVESEIGTGSLFTVGLPAVVPPSGT